VTDDGIATGATMIAALQIVKAQGAREVIVAVPVASPDRLSQVRACCDDVVCLLAPDDFWAIGQFYADFTQVEDEEVVAVLQEFAKKAACGFTKPQAASARGA
jgi:predicted phosphoribosyltransferase